MDHLALSHIIKSKAELTTTRIKRLLELLISYSFNLYFIKGKDMILSNFLSRQRHNDSNPHEIIPISFNMENLLHARYYNIDEDSSGRYLVQTESQAKSSGIKLPEAHGTGKGLDPNIHLEKQAVKPIVDIEAREVSQIIPKLSQGKAGIRCKIKTQISKPIVQVMERPSSKILVTNRSNIQDIAVPVPNYSIPSVNPKGDTSR